RARPNCIGWSKLRGCRKAGVMLIARFDRDVEKLAAAYDKAHDLIMSRGGAVPAGELRHHCALSHGALYIIGVWESDEAAPVAPLDLKLLRSRSKSAPRGQLRLRPRPSWS